METNIFTVFILNDAFTSIDEYLEPFKELLPNYPKQPVLIATSIH